MKNMSFAKMMAIFGGFVLLLIVCAVMIIKMNNTAPAAPQVTIKKYKAPAQADNASGSAQQPQARPYGASAPAATAEQPVIAPMAVNNPMVAPTGPMPAELAQVKPKLNSLDASVSELNIRVSALENRQLAAATAVATAPRAAHAIPVRRKAAPLTERTQIVPTTPMPGYKSLAVIGNRAWVRGADGTEDSVAAGDVVPRARVRTMDNETGVVITTTDERIETR